MQAKDAIFDLDNLLVDTGGTYQDGWLWGFRQFDIHTPKRIADAWGGKSWRQSLDILMQTAGNPGKVQEVRAEREEYFYQQLTSGAIQLKPYVREILTDLKECHMKLGITTIAVAKRATDILDHFQLADYFDTFTFEDEVSENRPSPVPYLTALERTGLETLSAFAVEDSLIEATAASHAELGVVLIPDSSFARNYSIEEKKRLNLLAGGKDLRTVIEMLDKKTEK